MICMYDEKFIIVTLLESRWQIVLSIGQAVGKKKYLLLCC